ncbi:NmrA-like protein [Teratosphaeria destructans]|uniref:NmrA-like protein n=1 Tax=Teratosphaeria destructans TaxID=418781 RepID=A0A9W7W4G3_9PEZI|nr:NmrA-like protein [Teratosphaeria destructans]
MPLNNIAVFGANGQLGQAIINALLGSAQGGFKVTAFIPPNTPQPALQAATGDRNYNVATIDVLNATQAELESDLYGIDAVVSALNGKALESQITIQDAAAAAVGVKRFYPSEYGFHHIYHKPDSDWGFVHPMWDLKAKLVAQAVRHPAIDQGKMTYTVIGCGDFDNQDREKVWCPWTQKEPESGVYKLHVIGSPDAKADYTHIDDFAQYLAATLAEPEKSENAHLNFVSDTISNREIATLLEKYTGKKAMLEQISDEDVHRRIADPDRAPAELKQSAFPVDFWHLVKGAQGAGDFRRPKGEIHNRMFPGVKTTGFEQYIARHLTQAEWDDLHGPAVRDAAEHSL